MTELKNSEYICATHGLSFEQILNETPKTTELPSRMFSSEKFFVAYNIS
jgi:hypothetical protein